MLQAEDASTGIKSKLVYRDEEELDTGVQKVQPLPFLGESIRVGSRDDHVTVV